MPYRELTMIDIKEVLRRWSARQSIHRIARETGVDRKTVRRYVRAAQQLLVAAGPRADRRRDPRGRAARAGAAAARPERRVAGGRGAQGAHRGVAHHASVRCG